jgi:hypothetical protein
MAEARGSLPNDCGKIGWILLLTLARNRLPEQRIDPSLRGGKQVDMLDGGSSSPSIPEGGSNGFAPNGTRFIDRGSASCQQNSKSTQRE